MSNEKTFEKTNPWLYFHIAVGLFFMLGFPQFGPFEPITETGMWMVGIFIGMVYLWSTVDSIWPSALGLTLVAVFSGYTGDITGYAAVKKVWADALGQEAIVSIILSMILFAGVEYVGCTKYLARFFLTRKIISGKPYVFLFIIFFCSYFVGGFTSPLASLLILWPLGAETMREFGYQRNDKVSWCTTFGIYLGATLGQPMFPFKGAPIGILGAFKSVSGLSVNYSAYIAYNFIISLIILVVYMLFLKVVIRPDVDKIKKVTPEQFKKNPLPPMNRQQAAFLLTALAYIVLLLLPNFAPASNPFIQLLKTLNVIGVTTLCVVTLMLLRFEGKPILDFIGIAKKSFSWNIFFLVTAALYVCTAVSAPSTGVKEFLVMILQPLLGNKPDFVFVLLLLAFALITTNFANNAGMAMVLMPIVMAFAEQYPGVPPTAICVSIGMMVFMAILTPAASPYAGMLHAQKHLISFKEIQVLGLPMCTIALLLYTFVGFPIAKILFATS